MAVYEAMKKCTLCNGTGKMDMMSGAQKVCLKCGGTGEDRPKTRGGMSTSYNNSQSSVAPRDEDKE